MGDGSSYCACGSSRQTSRQPVVRETVADPALTSQEAILLAQPPPTWAAWVVTSFGLLYTDCKVQSCPDFWVDALCMQLGMLVFLVYPSPKASSCFMLHPPYVLSRRPWPVQCQNKSIRTKARNEKLAKHYNQPSKGWTLRVPKPDARGSQTGSDKPGHRAPLALREFPDQQSSAAIDEVPRRSAASCRWA